MKTLGLALRNLLRNRRRSATTLLAMVIGMASVLLFGGYIRSITYGLQTGYVQRSGHLQIQHKEYFDFGAGNPASFGIADYRRVIDVVSRDALLAPMITVVTPTLQVAGIAGNFAAGVSRPVLATGIVAEDQQRLRHWNDYNLPPQKKGLGLVGTAADTAVIGNGVARSLRLCQQLQVPNCRELPAAAAQEGASAPADIVDLSLLAQPRGEQASGARIEMLTASAHGAPNVASLNVARAEDQGVKEFDDVAVTLHLAQAQRLVYGRETPQVTAILLQLKHTAQMKEAKARLNHLFATSLADLPLGLHEFTKLNPFYGQSIAMFSAIFGFISALMAAIVLFTVSNTMSMTVMERTDEIGTLRALGLRRGGIQRLFVAEGFLMGLIGACAGILISAALAAVINNANLTWLPPGRVEPVGLTIHVWGELWLVACTGAGFLAVAVLSAWLPAKRASRMNIVEALRHV